MRLLLAEAQGLSPQLRMTEATRMRLFLVGLSFLSLFIIFPPRALCDSPTIPFSYSVTSPNGHYLFIMLAPIDLEHDGIQWPEGKRLEAIRLRKKYSQSGLYLNDGTTIPIWTVTWYSRVVHLSDDGVHLIREGPWAEKLSDEAYTFFAGGSEIRSYKIGDLINSTAELPHTAGHFSWVQRVELNDSGKTFTIFTLTNHKIVFDYTTGEIIQDEISSKDKAIIQGNNTRSMLWEFFVGFILILSLLCIGIYAIKVYNRYEKNTARSP
jgi:hypothetical protein